MAKVLLTLLLLLPLVLTAVMKDQDESVNRDSSQDSSLSDTEFDRTEDLDTAIEGESRNQKSLPGFVERLMKRLKKQDAKLDKRKKRRKKRKKTRCGGSYTVRKNQNYMIRLKSPCNCTMIFRAARNADFKLSCTKIIVGSCETSQLHLSSSSMPLQRVCDRTVTVKRTQLTDLLLAHRLIPALNGTPAENSVVKCNVIGGGGDGYKPLGTQQCPATCGIAKANADSLPSLYFDASNAVDLLDEPLPEETSTDLLREEDDFLKNWVDSPVAEVKVEGGSTAAISEWPWMVYLKLTIQRSSLFCGGTILSARFVLTAAHCVYDINLDKGDKIVAVANEFDIKNKNETERQSIKVQKIFVHPKYSSQSQTADIAVLKLKSEFVFGPGVAPICLAPEGVYEDHSVVVLGWGSLSFSGREPMKLQKGTQKVTNLEDCARNYTLLNQKYKVTKKHVCAAAPGVDSCLGDSGGPILLQLGSSWYQLGIVSFGEKCAVPGYPGVNTNVPSYLSWIYKKMKNENC